MRKLFVLTIVVLIVTAITTTLAIGPPITIDTLRQIRQRGDVRALT